MATPAEQPEPTPVDVQLIPSVAGHLNRRRDSLFAALDGSRLRLANDEFEVEVYSITDQVAGRWVQLGFRNSDEHFITLRLPRQAGFPQARKALLTLVAETPELTRHHAAA
jgi:hypothetical protein